MFRRILVPVDFNRDHGRTLGVARELARQERGSIVLLHIVQAIEGIPFSELERFYARLEAAARKKLEAMAGEIAGEGEGVTVEQHVAFGDRVFEIVRRAKDEGADLIVLTSHRVDPRSGAEGAAGFGTISYKVGILASCPVLLVK